MAAVAESHAASPERGTLLRDVSVLSGLSEELRERLAAEATVIEVRAGEWLLRKNDPAQSLYVIRSGRLEVIDEGPPETVIRTLRRGEVLGELALLKGGRRSASVRALRDSELLEVGSAQFEALVEEAPGYALGLLRTMVAQLAVSRIPLSATALPRTISVVGLDAGAPVAELADLLGDALAKHGSLGRLSSRTDIDSADLASALDRAESQYERVLLTAEAPVPADRWSGFCLQEADLVIAVTTGQPDPVWLASPAPLLGCELIVVGPGVAPPVVRTLAPREVQVLRGDGELRHGMGVTARRLVGRAVGVVLSGGGARAFAHIGVLEELKAAGVVIDRIGAASLGAIVGAGVAVGYEDRALRDAFTQSFVDRNPSNDYTLPAYSMTRGRKARRMLDEHFSGARIEELPVRFFCLSCDLIAREPFVHRVGPITDAVYASLAIPGLFPPVSTPEGRLLVDGGVLDNLPVGIMAATGEGPVIAVDVTGRVEPAGTRSRPRLGRISRRLRYALTGSETEIPRLAETVLRTLMVGSTDTVAAARAHADVVITPEVNSTGLLEFGKLEASREAGRVAARKALAATPALFGA